VDALRDVTTNAEVATSTWIDLGVVALSVALALGLGAATLRRRTA
jgi:ABC-2 type transport system permease protein